MTIGKSLAVFLNARLRFLVVLFPLFTLVGCHYAEGVATTLQRDEKSVFRRLAVVPFQQIVPDDDESRTAHCPICGAVFTTNKFSREPERILDNILLARLRQSATFRLLDPENVAGVYRRLSSGAAKTALPEILKNLGRELGAEGVVAGYVYRYQEREGYPYSVRQPASVAFEIHLLRGSDGAQVWRGIFDKTQRSLAENILQLSSFYRQKGRWATAEELAQEGMDEILKAFPGFREGQKD